MVTKNSSLQRKFNFSYFKSELKSYWWLMMISGILYFVAGPLVMWMGLEAKLRYSDGVADSIIRVSKMLSEWFNGYGLMSFYVIAMILAALIPAIVFGYLNNKKQVNFYHSMPISRRDLFVNNTLIGILVNFIPMLIALGCMIIIALVYGSLSDIRFSFIVLHLLYIFLYFMLSYVLALVAVQLTGTVLTQIAMTGVLHFALLGGLLNWALLKSEFYSTFADNWDNILIYSPITNFALFMNKFVDNYYGTVKEFIHLPITQLVAIIGIIVVGLVLAWVGYKKRASESATTPVIYGWLRPILKFVVMFIAVGLCGIMFLEIGGKTFFFVGFVIAALLVQMFMEIIYNKDFKAMFNDKKGFAVMFVVLLAVYGSMYADVFKFDSYVAKASDVKEVRLSLDGLDYAGYVYKDDEWKKLSFTNKADIENVCELLDNIVDSKTYYRNSNIYDNDYVDNYNKTSSVAVTYVLNSGRVKERKYDNVPLSIYKAEVEKIYESATYKDQVVKQYMLNDERELRYLNLNAIDSKISTGNVLDFSYNWNEKNAKKLEYANKLREAFVKDIANRNMDTLNGVCQYEMNLAYGANQAYNNNWFYVNIYAGDVYTMAVIDEMKKDGYIMNGSVEDLAKYINELKVYSANSDINIYDIDKGNVADEDFARENDIVLQKTVTDKAEIKEILANTITLSDYENSSSMLEIDKSLFVLCENYVNKDGSVIWASEDGEVIREENMNNSVMFYKLGEKNKEANK